MLQSGTRTGYLQEGVKITKDKRTKSKVSRHERDDLSNSKGNKIQKESWNRSGSKEKNLSYFSTSQTLTMKTASVLQNEKNSLKKKSKERVSINKNDRNQVSKSRSKSKKSYKFSFHDDLKKSDQISYCSRAVSPESQIVRKLKEESAKKYPLKKHLSPKYSKEVNRAVSPYYPPKATPKKMEKKLKNSDKSEKTEKNSMNCRITCDKENLGAHLKDKEYSIYLDNVDPFTKLQFQEIESEIRIENICEDQCFVEEESVIIRGLDEDIHKNGLPIIA